MRSGNGRHRRPRQTPAILVTAGVTGAGLAIPLLGATGAQAADGGTWDQVAQCESGGLWSANSGNGYYGGLQLTLETWEEYGGAELAARPDLASRSQQIEIAEKILEDQGPRAWPSCSTASGLLEDLPEPPSDAPSPSDGPTWEPEPDAPSVDDVVPTTPGRPDPPSAPQPDESEAPVPDTPERPDGTTGTGAGIDGQDETAAPETDAREGTGRHRGAADDREHETADRPSRGKHGGGYRVRPGDSLSAIAAEHDVRGGWSALYEANRETVGDDPDLIKPGQRLSL